MGVDDLVKVGNFVLAGGGGAALLLWLMTIVTGRTATRQEVDAVKEGCAQETDVWTARNKRNEDLIDRLIPTLDQLSSAQTRQVEVLDRITPALNSLAEQSNRQTALIQEMLLLVRERRGA